MVAIPPKPPTKTNHTTTTNRRRHAEHDQHSHLKSTRPWPFQATTGGFTTIDPRHAGDTPQSSAYGSNSPQATNKDKPHHQDNWTRMSNTTHATTPPQTSATASPTETPPAPPSQTPQHHTETQPRPNRRPLHPKNPMSPAFHRGGLHFEQPRGRFTTIDPSTGTRRLPFRATTRGVLRP